MCLMVHQPKDTILPDDLVKDVYTRNPDGIGVMWAESGKLKFKKAIVTDADEFLKFYKENIVGKECVWHARMMTHGDVDLENCHPYPVFGFDGTPTDGSTLPLLMMHNGILDYGNAADKTKSDTWHYIRNFLRPMLKDNTEFAFTEAFKSVVGKHITGANRFAFMDPLGRVTLVNKPTGVEYAGAWFSNTYAWAAHKYMPSKWSNYTYTGGPVTTSAAGSTSYTQKELDDDWDSSLDSRYKQWKKDRDQREAALTTSSVDRPKSKNQLKREKKKAARQAIKEFLAQEAAQRTGPQTGRETDTGTATTTTGSPRLDMIAAEYVDDVLEGRAILDVAYPDAETKDSEMETMIREMGPTKFFYALELLLEGRLPPNLWNSLAKSPKFAGDWARYVTTDKFKDVKPGTYKLRAGLAQATEENVH